MMHAAVLRYFDQVARHGSIRKAAEATNVAASAIDRQILRLEGEVGTPLFERLRRGVRLTPAGDIVLQHVRSTMLDWSRIRAEIASSADSVRGEVRVVCVESLLMVLLAETVAELAREHPKVSFTVDTADPAEIVRELRHGNSDLGVMWVDKRNRHLEILAQLEARLGAVMHASHPLARRRQVTVTECAAYPVILMPNLWALLAVSEIEFSKSGARFQPRVRTSSFELARRMMIEDLGIGFFLPFGFAAEIGSGELVHLPFSEPQFRNNFIGLVQPRDRPASPAARLLRDGLIRRMRSLERRPPAARRR